MLPPVPSELTVHKSSHYFVDNTIIIAFETHDDNLLNVNIENSNKYGDLAVAISHSLIFWKLRGGGRSGSLVTSEEP